VTSPRPVRALVFDLDGTLVDTENQTDHAVEAVVSSHGVQGFVLPHFETRGRTWGHVAETIRARTGINIPVAALTAELLTHWNSVTVNARPIPGAPHALRAAAAAGLKLAVVSSSPRAVINRFVDQLGVAPVVGAAARIGGDDVQKGKPDPAGFLLAARVLGVDPAEALVFEDSRAGLLAARAAGMRSMFITCCAADIAGNSTLATTSFTDYRSLPPELWAELLAGSADLGSRTFA